MNSAGPIPWVWRAFLAWVGGLTWAGWLLSAIGQLNPVAYGFLVLAGSVGSVIWWRRERNPSCGRLPFWRRRARWRRLLPAGFLVLVGLSLLGGLLYVPNNTDALGYRTPRVLHWLAEGRWHWIECPHPRLNVRVTGMEWVTAPIFALTQSDRLLFLVQFTCYLLFPGAIFSFLRVAGIRRVVAWRWMWLFPTGYCYLVQAGGIANDLLGTTLGTIAVALAWRARRGVGEDSANALRWSFLAIAMATNAKVSNLLLTLPWFVIALPALTRCVRRPVLSLATALLGLVASMLPNSWINWRQCGDWTGAKLEYAWVQPNGSVASVIHNVFEWSIQNLTPPLMPMARQFNAVVENHLPEFWVKIIEPIAEGKRQAYHIVEMPGEEYAGLGAWVSWWLILGLVWRLRQWSRWRSHPAVPGIGRTLLYLVPWISLIVFESKSAMKGNGRVMASFYPWLLPSFLMLSVQDVLSRRVRRWLELMTLGFGVLVLILCPSRPLFPTSLVERWAGSNAVGGILRRVTTVYRVYGERWDALAKMRDQVPADVKVLGFITGNDSETSLWRPYGSRRVRHVVFPYARAQMDRVGIRWLVVNVNEMETNGRKFDEWLKEVRAEVIHREPLQLRASHPPDDFAVVRLQPAEP